MLFTRAISISILAISAVVALPVDGAVARPKSLPDILLDVRGVIEPESYRPNPNISAVLSVLSVASQEAVELIGHPVEDILTSKGELITSKEVAYVLFEVLKATQKVFFKNPIPASTSKALPNLLSTLFVGLLKIEIYRALKPELRGRFIYDWSYIGQTDVAILLRNGKP
ncbi:hypothetical protein H0H93_015256 [Arthromyces matolae]|nr:hypothetical protein H0H93_015256 [Arthromyces matolae]